MPSFYKTIAAVVMGMFLSIDFCYAAPGATLMGTRQPFKNNYLAPHLRVNVGQFWAAVQALTKQPLADVPADETLEDLKKKVQRAVDDFKLSTLVIENKFSCNEWLTRVMEAVDETNNLLDIACVVHRALKLINWLQSSMRVSSDRSAVNNFSNALENIINPVLKREMLAQKFIHLENTAAAASIQDYLIVFFKDDRISSSNIPFRDNTLGIQAAI